VLCKVEHKRGDFMLPYGSYLGGEFAEYKDPGHFVGKGWMELSFDRLYVGDTVVPINAKVVDVPGYKIDEHGRILGKGHAVRDTILWMIPVLWPIDLLELPRRGPRPTLKQETALTLRVMDDLKVPTVPEPQRDPYGLYQRGSNSDAPQPPFQQPEPEQQNAYVPEQPAPAEQPAPPAMAYVPPVIVAPYVAPVVMAPYPPVYAYGGIVIAPRVVYAPRAYVGLPMARPVAPRVYAYGYAGPGFAGGAYGSRAGYVYRGARMR